MRHSIAAAGDASKTEDHEKMALMRALLACLATTFLACASTGTGAQLFARNTCPQKIDVEQRVISPPEGWDGAQITATVALASVTFFDGPPSGNASLKYDSEDRQKRDWIAYWNLAPNARGYWISCGYENTTAVVSRRLPEDVRSCAVTYERKKRGKAGLPTIKSITCK